MRKLHELCFLVFLFVSMTSDRRESTCNVAFFVQNGVLKIFGKSSNANLERGIWYTTLDVALT